MIMSVMTIKLRSSNEPKGYWPSNINPIMRYKTPIVNPTNHYTDIVLSWPVAEEQFEKASHELLSPRTSERGVTWWRWRMTEGWEGLELRGCMQLKPVQYGLRGCVEVIYTIHTDMKILCKYYTVLRSYFICSRESSLRVYDTRNTRL